MSRFMAGDLSTEQIDLMNAARELFQEIETLLDAVPNGPRKELALTELEGASYRVNSAIARS